jgi:hypothetical protein
VRPIDRTYRPFSFTIGVGPGTLASGDVDEDAALGLSYNLFRLGFGLAPSLQFTVAFEGMGRNSVSPQTNEDSWLKQENWMLGIQYHLLSRLYFRGSVGIGHISEHTDSVSNENPSTGIAVGGALGYEFLQTNHVALALDLNAGVTEYAHNETWSTFGLNLALTFY